MDNTLCKNIFLVTNNCDTHWYNFIEGGRTKTGELMRPRSGCAVIARQTKAPVNILFVYELNQQIQGLYLKDGLMQ